MDALNPVADDADANLGLKARYVFTQNSSTVDMIGPIHSDIFFQDCLILNRVNLRLKLNRAKNSFCLVSPTPGILNSAPDWLKFVAAILDLENNRVYCSRNNSPLSHCTTVVRPKKN